MEQNSEAAQRVYEDLEKLFGNSPEVREMATRYMAEQARMETVADIFASYRGTVMPKNASAQQIIETEQAMYAAVNAMLSIFGRYVGNPADDGSLTQQWLQARVDECEQFARQKIAGRLNGR